MPQFAGYKYSNYGVLNNGVFESVTILGDGTSTVYVYYARLTYTITVNYYYVGTTDSIRNSISERKNHTHTHHQLL